MNTDSCYAKHQLARIVVESTLSRELLLSSNRQLQNSSPEQTLLSSQDNMNDSLIVHQDNIQIDGDESQEVLSSINIGLTLSIHLAKGSGGNGETTKNNM